MTNTIKDFLKFANSQKEVSLMIAKDENELEDFIKKLSEGEFRQAVDTSDLFKQVEKASKSFVVIKDVLPKDLYDFAVQYPTGQVEIYDKFNKKPQVMQPSYKDTAIIYAMTEETLTKTFNNGFDILNKAGITYKS